VRGVLRKSKQGAECNEEMQHRCMMTSDDEFMRQREAEEGCVQTVCC